MPAPGVYAFEEIDDALALVPLAARRTLDAVGRKLSLAGWLSLPLPARAALVAAGTAETVAPAALDLLAAASPAAAPLAVPAEPDPAAPPRELLGALGPSRPLEPERWRALDALGRFALARYASKPEKLARAYDEIVGGAFSHLDARGAARMVDVGGKPETARRAVATARVRTTPAVVKTLADGGAAKGDVLAAARIAGILASKRTPELVPLCHPVRTTKAGVDLALEGDAVLVRATIEAVDRTGVEMEAMVAASVAALTVYDMIKSADRWASVEAVRLESKQGGKSGSVARPPGRS